MGVRLPAGRVVDAAMTATQPKLILVVEDDPGQRDIYRRLLGHAGYSVIEAADSETAVAQVHARKPDLVLMDVTLPGPSGWNATREIKSHPDTHRTPVVVVTGLVGLSDRDASFASGGDAYLEKPVQPRVLLDEIARILQRRDSSPG